MKKHVHPVIILSMMLILSSAGCSLRYYDANTLLNDYKTEGFLDRDHFQVIITGTPDKDAKGLVVRRESSLKNAKAAMNLEITNSLVAYELDYQIKKNNIDNMEDILNMPDVIKHLSKESQQFFQYGETAFEYYNADNSVVIVYRIFRKDLIDKVESIKPGFKLPPPEKKSD